jgi:NTP pyrophosphatase (non-canonical NTP hydrolase)
MAVSISIESAELLEQFQWKNAEECEAHLQENREAVADEMADVAIYLFELADLLQMDLGNEMLRKLDKNAAKYPVEKARGSNLKYNRLD